MSKKKTNKESALEGIHLSILEDWVDKGKTETLPDEMVEYLDQLNFINALWRSVNSPQKIIKKLSLTYNINELIAKSRFEDAMTWFYLDDKVKKDSWRNALFEKLLQLADAAILSAKTVDDYNKASIIIERAYRVKGLDKDEDPGIPDEAFNKPTKVYSLDTSDFEDLPQTNRHLLGQYVDEMNILESEKVRIKREAGLEPKELFDSYEQKKDS
ncbi:hypothetical protein [Abyssalbus ytuae]|uniref:Uncharacterized protein n=1 Tax=Abyssalbus ytuae TaxID=2926907 RepID=A0A9E6ZZ85_9FLAO|nr:hypothetical protein [Abyssalbus ytuae]UOB16581.1 hypothetical protein MQE35_12650 [Abyssalbus ytuae]